MNYSRREGCLIKHTEMALAYLSSISGSLLDLGTNHSMVLAVSSLHPQGTRPGSQRHDEKADRRGRSAGEGPEMAEVAFGRGVR